MKTLIQSLKAALGQLWKNTSHRKPLTKTQQVMSKVVFIKTLCDSTILS